MTPSFPRDGVSGKPGGIHPSSFDILATHPIGIRTYFIRLVLSEFLLNICCLARMRGQEFRVELELLHSALLADIPADVAGVLVVDVDSREGVERSEVK